MAGKIAPAMNISSSKSKPIQFDKLITLYSRRYLAKSKISISIHSEMMCVKGQHGKEKQTSESSFVLDRQQSAGNINYLNARYRVV